MWINTVFDCSQFRLRTYRFGFDGIGNMDHPIVITNVRVHRWQYEYDW